MLRKLTVEEEMRRYLDFDVLVDRFGSGFRTRVLNSPAGEAFTEFQTPFTDQEVENLFLRVGRPNRSTRRIGSPEAQAVKKFGTKLFDVAFGGEVRTCFANSLSLARRQDAGLRVRLRLSDAGDLADLPWEYLHNSTFNRSLSLSTETPIVRYLELAEPVVPLSVRSPLRLLVMVSSPNNYPKLDSETEWRKLREALGPLELSGRIVLERLPECSLGSLQRRLRKDPFHIFHFIGHGEYDIQSSDGRLLLEGTDGRGKPVSGENLGVLLRDHKSLRLAVLNACEGARSGRSDPFSGVAQSFIQQGIAAVIAMQFEITDEAAIAFARDFYSAVADGYPIDASVAEARRAIFAHGNDTEWGTPVLYMRSPDGHIFDVNRAAEPVALFASRNTATVTIGADPVGALPIQENVHSPSTRVREMEIGSVIPPVAPIQTASGQTSTPTKSKRFFWLARILHTSRILQFRGSYVGHGVRFLINMLALGFVVAITLRSWSWESQLMVMYAIFVVVSFHVLSRTLSFLIAVGMSVAWFETRGIEDRFDGLIEPGFWFPLVLVFAIVCLFHVCAEKLIAGLREGLAEKRGPP